MKEKLFEHVGGNQFKITNEVSSNLPIWGAFYWDDPNMGWGFAGWADFVYAKTEKEAEQKLGGYSMGIGFEKLTPSKVSKIKKEMVEKIKKQTELLKKLNNPTR